MKWIAFFVMMLATGLFGMQPLTETDKDNLKKVRTIEHVMFESYTETDKGLASVIGYHFDWFFSDRVFGALSIFGAVGGERGGYGIAAFGGGYRHPLSRRWDLDIRGAVGSGGGGGLAAGGGFALQGHVGLSYALMRDVFLDAKLGYLAFPTGEFETPTVTVGLAYQRFSLFLPW